MSTDKISKPLTIIEIVDSSDDDSQQVPTSISSRTEGSIPDESTNSSEAFDPPVPTDIVIVNNTSKEPKKIHNRRKSLHQSVRSIDDLSFESVITHGKRTESEDLAKEIKKKRWDESSIDEAIENSNGDEEIAKMLKKIAYCRVFTNYLLRQYDMLSIDFKLYSNIDLLMLELKKRVDTYSAIRRSRQQLLFNKGDAEIV